MWESEKDPEFDKLLLDIMIGLNDNGIPHDLVPAGFIVLEEDYEDTLKIITNCIEGASARGRATTR
jgi:hypothetical protein